MILRRSGERGLADHGWLRSFHTFSFADYHDAAHMGFRALRVINEDRVQPGQGFGTHGHQDMEDHLLRPRRTSSSTRIRWEPARSSGPAMSSVCRPGPGCATASTTPRPPSWCTFCQIWILPDRRGLVPSYEERSFSVAQRTGKLCLLASSDGRDGSLTVHQDVQLFASLLGKGDAVRHALAPGRAAWVQVTKGGIAIAGEKLAAGDAAAIEEPGTIELRAEQPSEVLLFDLA